MQDSVVSYNSASSQGSAFYIESANKVVFQNVTFESNSGALYRSFFTFYSLLNTE